MNWLLDTDVICQPAKSHGDARVIAWIGEEQDRSHTSAVVIAQLACWVRTKDGAASVADAACGRTGGSNSRVQRFRGACMADQERLLGEGRPAHARRRQLHRGNRPEAWADYRHRQRSPLQASRAQSVQSVQEFG